MAANATVLLHFVLMMQIVTNLKSRQNSIANTPEILHSADILCCVQGFHYMMLPKLCVRGELVENCLLHKIVPSVIICEFRTNLAKVHKFHSCLFFLISRSSRHSI